MFLQICSESALYPQEVILILFCCFNLLLEAYQLYSEVSMNKYFFVNLLKIYMYGISRLHRNRGFPAPSPFATSYKSLFVIFSYLEIVVDILFIV